MEKSRQIEEDVKVSWKLRKTLLRLGLNFNNDFDLNTMMMLRKLNDMLIELAKND
jgi:hypothetical protein